MSKSIKLNELFGEVVEKANDYEKELERLNKIEQNIRTKIQQVQGEIKGLEKAIGYSSICWEARNLLEKYLVDRKREINNLNGILNESYLYKDLK